MAEPLVAFKGVASLTGASTVVTTGVITTTGLVTTGAAGIKIGAADALTSVQKSAADDADDDIISTKGYVDEQVATVSGGNSIILINNSSGEALANATLYTLNSGGAAISSALTTGALTTGTIVRFVCIEAGGGTSTITLAGGGFKLVGGNASSIVFDTAGQGVDFLWDGTSLLALGGGFLSASA